MWIFRVGDVFAKLVFWMLPKIWSDRILENCGEMEIYVLATKSTRIKPRMTFIEGVFATLLFDWALFGTSNFFIKSLIRLFTNLQNSWDKPFSCKKDAVEQITEFCFRLNIQQEPWIWEKPMQEYACLNDFFSRTFAKLPAIGEAQVVSPASCTLQRYNDNDDLKKLLIKGCAYDIQQIGLLPPVADYATNPVLVGYLSPTDYHRVHAPMEGRCIHCQLEGVHQKSASVKFLGGKFNILNENKRLVIVLESDNDGWRMALVVIGGIGVDTIVYDPNVVGTPIQKGQELATFRAGGSAIALFFNKPLVWTPEYEEAKSRCRHVQVQVAESLGNLKQQ